MWITVGLIYWFGSGRVFEVESHKVVPTIAGVLMMVTFAVIGLQAALKKGDASSPDDKPSL